MRNIQKMIKTSHYLCQKNLVGGGSGNLSYRSGDFMFITISGARLGKLKEKDIMMIPIQGKFNSINNIVDLQKGSEKHRIPSCEVFLHLKVYRRSDSKAIIHSHPTYSIIISRNFKELECITEGATNLLGKSVSILREYESGSQKLAEKVCDMLEDERAVIVKNHGVFARGENFDSAIDATQLIEKNSKIKFISSIL